MKKSFIFLITFHVSLFTLHFTKAQIINVPADQPSIQAGIDAALSGDTVLVDTGTWLENINFLGKDITVASNFIMDGDTNHINSTIIDGSDPDNPDYGSVVTFITGEDTTSVLCGFTITGGTGTDFPADSWRLGGGILCYYAGAKIINNKIINNEVISDNEADGAGIGCFHDLIEIWAVIENNTISGNVCNGTNLAGGGGIFAGCNARIINNRIDNNHIIGQIMHAVGGGIYTGNNSGNSDTIYFLNNMINHNTASSTDFARGGGVFSIDNYLIIRDNIISHDSLTGDRTNGGGLNIINSVYLEMTGNLITYNIVEKINIYWGAGVFCVGPKGPVIVTNNEFSYNQGELSPTGAGGGFAIIDTDDYPVLVDGNQFLYNSAYHGGGFYQRSCYNLVLSNNLFIGNDTYRGGAIGIFHYEDPGSEYRPLIVNNTFHDNHGSSDAGAIRFLGDFNPPIILNCIFWENDAPDGNAIRNWSDSSIIVSYSDIDETEIVGLWTGEGNINKDPLLIDPENENYCIDSCNSPCAGAGADSIAINEVWYFAPDHDISNSQRPLPVFTPPDMGAYEVDLCPGITEEVIQNLKLKIQTYPNPTHGILDFRLLISDFVKVTAKIYDMHGREVANVLDKNLPAGEHVVRYDASQLHGGIYLVRVKAGVEAVTEKLVVQRE